MKALSRPILSHPCSLRRHHPNSSSFLWLPSVPANNLPWRNTPSLRFSKHAIVRMQSSSAAASTRRRIPNDAAAAASPPRSPRSSLYSRPSLREIQSEKSANRALVYDFLRSLGIVPDELDGLDLPATVAVMKERVDFLQTLGLTVADINAYPLVLGCSVKKNMIPVLDYLGKIGVRKSTFTDFLRRYPQVLHSSVVVDLAPVVKYLQGMDIRPQSIPRVLEKYPELLGFKLEGTMSTSVAFLVGIGVNRREIGGILTRFPEILGMRVGRVIKPLVEYLESVGLPRAAVAKLIEKKPQILGFGLENQVKPNVECLVEFGVRMEAMAAVIAQHPEIVGIAPEDLREKLASLQILLESTMFLEVGEFGGVIEKMPLAVGLSRAVVVRHVNFFRSCGFSLNQVKKMVASCPQILALNMEIMKSSFEYFKEEMDGDLEDLAAFPAFFTYGLDSIVKPRHRIVARKGIKCSLAWLLNCSDSKFEERMKYDSIGIDEMEEEDDGGFDMKSFMASKSDEDDDDDYDDDDEDSDDDYA